jgi:hypothetical protein
MAVRRNYSILFFLFIFFALTVQVKAFGLDKVTYHGPILIHGQKYEDIWSNEIGHPPMDGSITTWSFYKNGDQIVTKGNFYWIKSNNSSIWTTGILSEKWKSCTNFPTTGVDAYSIHPDTGEEFIFKGYLLFTMNSSGVCTRNGLDWKSSWQSAASPLGEYPFKNYSKVSQFQFINGKLQAVFTGDKLWIIGENTQSSCARPGASWHFCEPETLTERWVTNAKYEIHPPLTSIGIYAVSYLSNYHISTSGEYIWTLGEKNIWDTFRSGIDGYGMREAFFLKANGKYYLYYDAEDAYQAWVPALAVADHPQGPWKKLGLVQINGTKRPWESETSTAVSVFYDPDTNKYFNFYLGANSYWGGTNDSRYRVPGYLPNGYYAMGVAVADNPAGPFTRLKGDGTWNPSTTTDAPILPSATTGWHPNTEGSAQGSIIYVNGNVYYTYTTQEYRLGHWGVGAMKSLSNTLLGPWVDTGIPLIPFGANSENSSIFQSPWSKYFLFSNITINPDNPDYPIYNPGCAPATGLVMYWSDDFFNWTWSINRYILAHAQPGYGCSGDGNIIPGITPQHRGIVGLGSQIYVPEEDKLYVAYDGGDINSADVPLKNHMFRNIFLISLDLKEFKPTPTPTNIPVPTPTNTPIPTPTPTPMGDANADGKVDANDLLRWQTGFINNLFNLTYGNFNQDDKVDGKDYLIWLFNFGK